MQQTTRIDHFFIKESAFFMAHNYMYESVSVESGYCIFCINFMSLCTGEKSVV